ncbi:MAG: putative Holliday junction resolvase [Candidatus Berkelbacteria bacterium Licking1014_7]|uniref:Putative pre-16S rRNA nuclease n=1 Tax=Candidatus Berkelbacteria bacterium Licking1014_7 TaxID=2017147 RepID=A0A554LJJ8_9BACT|nr:MAG: putative Holliday junction resolvase [Candidatus Berkelbacteria bacterium Licking1014_7]
MSIIALDVGDKKIGAAISFSGMQVQPFITYDRKNFSQIIKIIKDSKVSRLVVGLAKNQNGKTTPQTKQTLVYIKQLRSELKKAGLAVQIFFEDERLTTVSAEDELIAKNKKGKKEKIHSFAARLILEQHLSKKNRANSL